MVLVARGPGAGRRMARRQGPLLTPWHRPPPALQGFPASQRFPTLVLERQVEALITAAGVPSWELAHLWMKIPSKGG